ncbi:hypothetical protein JCM16418A_41900 [Paenibacillus pini]|uniref:Conserved hypothetical protein CHP02391 domain-containing protein n=1 Tax=Paenibacillus pini JCM 16418 TaxID=1236976 RepID=W7YY18_9BACL|nr:TIGR02391 family protein [Paenibacillus pini]GAF09556.1 hypothetical protein JCM16418_3700 [Paenibacillus pini JCM 16418]
MALATVKMNNEEWNKLLIRFCKELADSNNVDAVIETLTENGLPYNLLYKDELDLFLGRQFHSEVSKHCRVFLQGNYFHAVFEAAKAYDYFVKGSARSDKDGVGLMMDVLSVNNGVLK